MNEVGSTAGPNQVKRRKRKTAPAAGRRRRSPGGIDFSALAVTKDERPMGRGAPPRLSDAHISVLQTLDEPDAARRITLPANMKAQVFVREFRRVLKRNRPEVRLMSANLGKGEVKLWVVPQTDKKPTAVAAGS